MKDKTLTLTGEKLAEWTAMAQKWKIVNPTGDRPCWFTRLPSGEVKSITAKNYRPDINGGQAMELAKKFGLVVYFAINSVSDGRGGKLYQNNAIEIAICHAVVASVFGEEVDDGT